MSFLPRVRSFAARALSRLARAIDAAPVVPADPAPTASARAAAPEIFEGASKAESLPADPPEDPPEPVLPADPYADDKRAQWSPEDGPGIASRGAPDPSEDTPPSREDLMGRVRAFMARDGRFKPGTIERRASHVADAMASYYEDADDPSRETDDFFEAYFAGESDSV